MLWNPWDREYLNTLQQRSKWQFEKDNVHPGNLALIEKDDLPTNKYISGRITNVYPDADGRVRGVEIRKEQEIIKRLGWVDY